MFTILGIDIGSVAISLALIDEDKKILQTAYCFHQGLITRVLQTMVNSMNLELMGGIAVTSTTPDIVKNAFHYDTQVSIISACRHLHDNVGSILFVGGENFGLIKFNEKGEYESYKTNSSCAAGTGSFLDQQAKRLNLQSSEVLSDIAFSNIEDFPEIATRCAVFAKTDLIHAQQEGYSPGQISDGLCEGLAKNIIHTLIPDESRMHTPLFFAGGVSMNQAVVKHIKNLLKIEPVVDEYSQLYGAIGAALLFLEEHLTHYNRDFIKRVDLIIQEIKTEKTYGFKPLELLLSHYPEFSSEHSYHYTPRNNLPDVEVDIYKELKNNQEVYMGIDIGSTSTKAVLIDRKNNVLAGFYTGTSGQPIKATQALFEAIDHLSQERHVVFSFCGVGTTGSGRKFIGKVINADLIIDEITAHARAAYELNNDVDTIIEIGGQDAKFTSMKNGMVTFSIMNNVCAAGTGSFIEEQAQKLGCPLSEYAGRALNTPAPLASDRCTVFMERDINHYLINGYSVNEVLASVLHSVRENYLTKVAVEAAIGNEICFQGATAKNKALVAAFEQRLNKPIFVSKYCHLTGALGSALILSENKFLHTQFRGINLYKDEIPIESEVCKLCLNNCKINKVTVQGDIVAFGFLCGRDYDTKKYVNNKKNIFRLVDEHKKIFKLTNTPGSFKTDKTIGIPLALYLSEEGIIWRHFFNSLGVKIITSEKIREPVKTGKEIAAAEFCAPVSAYFGHVKYLAEKADFLFLPVYLETREKENIKKYCYFSQYASSLAASVESLHLKDRTIMPVIDSRHFTIVSELVKILRPVIRCSYWTVYFAYQGALAFYNDRKEQLKNIFQREFERANNISILFLGRPYTILDRNMNKRIPDMFENLHIKTFYQDMLPYSRAETGEINELLGIFHWNYTSKILESAVVTAKKDGLYPVYITSFKCGPDSFAIEYFKKIMDTYQKPYLILQLDEHDSNVGYETRIEAAIRSFQNHYTKLKNNVNKKNAVSIIPKVEKKLDGKTLLFPCWDQVNSKLIEAVLLRNGIDARMVPLTKRAIQLGPRTNTGMCIPVNIITQSYLDYIESNKIDPAQTVAWMFESHLACNIKLFPYFIKSIFESYGRKMEKVTVYMGDMMFREISYQIAIDVYCAHMFGGMIRKIGCNIRPYEKEKGITDKTIDQSLLILYNTFLGNRHKEDDVIKIVNLFKKIETSGKKNPKVAIFGDMYVRDNDIMNQDLIHCIEDYGGEAVIMPFNEIIKLLANPFIERSMKSRIYIDAFATKAILTFVNTMEKSYFKHFNEILCESRVDWNFNYREVLDYFHVKVDHTGESADNLINIFSLKHHYPDIKLFVQTNPAFCCAGLITEAMISQIEKFTGVPVVPLNYDGTNKNQNEKIIPYLKYSV
ncbi:MAG: hypothetical protein JXB88_22760 [Spirochaetales bacterium]|nr:hypothetical protein [Spirochaetales bacterium]